MENFYEEIGKIIEEEEEEIEKVHTLVWTFILQGFPFWVEFDPKGRMVIPSSSLIEDEWEIKEKLESFFNTLFTRVLKKLPLSQLKSD